MSYYSLTIVSILGILSGCFVQTASQFNSFVHNNKQFVLDYPEFRHFLEQFDNVGNESVKLLNTSSEYKELKPVAESVHNFFDNECRSENMLDEVTFNLDIKSLHWCGKIYLCNRTMCIVTELESMLFSKMELANYYSTQFHPFPSTEKYIPTPNLHDPEFTSIRFINGSEVERQIPLKKYDYDVNRDFFPSLGYSWGMMLNIAQVKRLTKHLGTKFAQLCLQSEKTNLFVEGVGELPKACSKIKLCGNLHCLVMSYQSLLFADILERNSSMEDMCNFVSHERRHHRQARKPIANLPKGILVFNLPGYRYCGPGTEIEKADDAGGPTNSLDEACRRHDLDYLTGTAPEVADKRFLTAVQQISPLLYPLFLAVFKAKAFFETMTGKTYTSYLYFYPEKFNASLTLSFSSYSVYDDHVDNTQLLPGQEAEKRWIKILHGIWEGTCTNPKLYSELPFPVEGNESPPSGLVSSISNAIPSDSSISIHPSGQEPQKSQSELPASPLECSIPSIEGVMYPSPGLQSGCRLIINEVSTSNDFNKISFIEHVRLCEKSSQVKTRKISGYVELILEGGNVIQQVLLADFFGKDLEAVVKQHPSRSKKLSTSHFFVIGNQDSKPHLLLEDTQATNDYLHGLPHATEKVICVVLLFFKFKDHSKSTELQRLKLKTDGEVYLPTEVTEERRNVIKNHLQDVFIIGPPCDENDCGFFFELLAKKPSVQDSEGLLLPQSEPVLTKTGRKPYISSNRCAKNLFPMQLESFEHAVPTPTAENNCPTETVELPFNLKGHPLQSTAQKLIVNVVTYLEKAAEDSTLCAHKSSPLQAAKSMLGVGYNTVTKVIDNYKRNSIKTPNKKRPNRVKPVLSQFDDFRVGHIKRVIQNFYKNNTPPLVKPVMEKVMEDVKEEEAIQIRGGQEVQPFSCSEATFRKALHIIGFKYGKINLRDVILMRPDIVSRRWKYIEALRKNRLLPNPKPIVYTDETWIDSFARTGKAIVPRKCTKYRERSLYGYSRNKVSRGPRIIVIHAGGADGFIEGAMRVYPVEKKKTTLDYHDNVNGEAYLSWARNLFEILKVKGPHIVVIDNAPYHTRAEVPKSVDRKEVMYNWLIENLEEPAKSQLKAANMYRKPELWNMIKDMRATGQFYVIDRLAKSYGHEILRLPPYNCDLNPIEYVWKDIKHEVRKSNTQQVVTVVVETAKKIMNDYTADMWRRHITHVNRLESNYWKEDGFFDRFLESHPQIVITAEDIAEADNETDDDEEEDDDDLPCGDMRSTVHDEYLFQNDDEIEQPCTSSRQRLEFTDDDM